jgi:Uncharacterized protein conserved in bacteria (DUF2255)
LCSWTTRAIAEKVSRDLRTHLDARRAAEATARWAVRGRSGWSRTGTASTSDPSTGHLRLVPWHRARHEGHVRAGGIDKDVTFLDADHDINDAIDAAYRHKYHYSAGTLDRITSRQARSTTIELVPRSTAS